MYNHHPDQVLEHSITTPESSLVPYPIDPHLLAPQVTPGITGDRCCLIHDRILSPSVCGSVLCLIRSRAALPVGHALHSRAGPTGSVCCCRLSRFPTCGHLAHSRFCLLGMRLLRMLARVILGAFSWANTCVRTAGSQGQCTFDFIRLASDCPAPPSMDQSPSRPLCGLSITWWSAISSHPFWWVGGGTSARDPLSFNSQSLLVLQEGSLVPVHPS